MGNSASSPELSYSLEVEGTKENDYSNIRRITSHPDGLVKGLQNRSLTNAWELFQNGATVSKSKKFLGKRTLLPDGGFGQYTWMSHQQAEKIAIQCGSGLDAIGGVPPVEFPEEVYDAAKVMRLVGIFSKNRHEWVLTELACSAYGYAMVPLYETLGETSVNFILKQTRLESIVVGGECVDVLLRVCEHSAVKFIIHLDPLTDSQKNTIKEKGLETISWDRLLEKGRKSIKTPTPPLESAINTVCFTSGTTGNPKGVLLTHGNFCYTVAAAERGPVGMSDLKFTPDDVHLSYLPLAHVLERIFCLYSIYSGCKIGFYSGDNLRLLEDIKELRPTFFISVPRLFYRINDRITARFKKLPRPMLALLQSGLSTKLKNIRNTGATTHAFWDKLLFGKTKALMGGHVRFIACGGAPINPDILERMSIFFCVPSCNGYGMTETTGCSFLSRPGDNVIGHIGGCIPSIEYRLKSVTEMDYNAQGSPPEGELFIRGHSVAKGYFLCPEQTSEAFLAGGWLRTGDVARVEAGGRLRIIDRAKSMFKLSQGEYVSPEKIESIFLQLQLVGQVFVHGESVQSHVVAIIVPDQEQAESWAKKCGKAGASFDDIIKMPQFILDVQKDINEGNAKLKGFERVPKFHLSSQAFSVENNFLTPTMKLRRPQLKKAYADDIKRMYA